LEAKRDKQHSRQWMLGDAVMSNMVASRGRVIGAEKPIAT
jgi:hypothetical protein